MSEVQDYPSRLSDPASRKFETFSYLPEMDNDATRKQVEYIVSKGWNPAIEHTEPENAFDHYWYMWKLPLRQLQAESGSKHGRLPRSSITVDNGTQFYGRRNAISGS